jgi:hypothetical protein
VATGTAFVGLSGDSASCGIDGFFLEFGAGELHGERLRVTIV